MPSAHTVWVACLRLVLPGCRTGRALRMAGSICKALCDCFPWVKQQSELVTSSVYWLLRLAADSRAVGQDALRRAIASTCTQLWGACRAEVAVIGRDLVRAARDAAEAMPELGAIWREMQEAQPGTDLHPATLMARHTPRRFLLLRMYPPLEALLLFMLTRVPFGAHRRYQQWAQTHYLPGRDAEAAIADVVRFMCCVFHPSNSLLQSQITPRWALAGWLVSFWYGFGARCGPFMAGRVAR